MTDKADKGWKFEPAEGVEEASVAKVSFEAAEVEELVVEESVVEKSAPQDPLTTAEKEAAAVADMIAEARANVEAAASPVSAVGGVDVEAMIAIARANVSKKTVAGGDAKKAAILAGRKKDLQKKIASLYTTGVWNGKPNYECTVCPYATLDEELIKQHVTKHI